MKTVTLNEDDWKEIQDALEYYKWTCIEDGQVKNATEIKQIERIYKVIEDTLQSP